MHVEWASAFTGLLVDLQAFVKKFHTTGLVWNANVGRDHEDGSYQLIVATHALSQGEVAKPGATGAPAAAKSGMHVYV